MVLTMTNRGINKYIKYVIKSPAVFIIYMSLSLAVIFILAYFTSSYIFITVDGLICGETILIDEKINKDTNFIFVYVDRNDGMFLLEITETIHEEHQTIFAFLCDNEFFDKNHERIHVEIPIEEITMFERIFIRGGRVR